MEDTDKVDWSKSEVNAQRILKRLTDRDLDAGGVYSEIVGSQGSGKTSVLLSFADYTIRNHPKEKTFWCECYNAPLQFPRLGNDNWILHVPEGDIVTFHDREHKMRKFKLPTKVYSDYDMLYANAEPGKLNVLFFPKRTDLRLFIKYLRNNAESWVSVFIDEMSEIAPGQTRGREWRANGDFALVLKDIRKSLMYIYSNTQAVSDCDYRVRGKLMLKIFMPGSRQDKNSRISQRALDNLDENIKLGNESYLEYSGRFGKVRFADVYRPVKGKHWEARVR